MKEKIYTIPVNEAFDENCECPLCFMRKKLEAELADYALGAAMMEPDYRIISNEKGYCNHHYSMMLPKKEKLSLSLVLDTHLKTIREKLELFSKDIENLNSKKSFFKKKNAPSADDVTDAILKMTDSCVICDRLNSTMERYISVVFHLWEKEKDFREKIINSKGFCIPHLNALLKGAFKYLSNNKANEFVKIIFDKQKEELTRIQDEIHRFTLKFDYRNVNEKWGSEIDAPLRTIEKLSGYIKKDE